MMNFTNQKGVAGLGVGSGTVVVQGGEKVVDGEGVVYWAAYAKTLTKNLEGLAEAKDEIERIAIERRANDAGLRAVIRYLLAEIRKANPDSPLLQKENRDKIFHEFRDEELKKVLNVPMWKPLERPAENQSP